jgi:hypothetical protein
MKKKVLLSLDDNLYSDLLMLSFDKKRTLTDTIRWILVNCFDVATEAIPERNRKNEYYDNRRQKMRNGKYKREIKL